VQIEVGDLDPDRRYEAVARDVVGQQFGRKKMRANHVIGSELLERVPELAGVEALDGASKAREQRIARHLVGRVVQVRPDRWMMLDQLDVIFGVERPEAPRHQRHYIDMPSGNIRKTRLSLGAERRRGTAMPRARGDAQQQNTFSLEHGNR
jgi:hypothetical protein